MMSCIYHNNTYYMYNVHVMICVDKVIIMLHALECRLVPFMSYSGFS